VIKKTATPVRFELENDAQLMVTATEAEGMPFATTTSVLAPNSMFAGTSNLALTRVLPVATPMVLGL